MTAPKEKNLGINELKGYLTRGMRNLERQTIDPAEATAMSRYVGKYTELYKIQLKLYGLTGETPPKNLLD